MIANNTCNNILSSMKTSALLVVAPYLFTI